MHDVRVERSVLQEYDQKAKAVRESLAAHDIHSINVMGAIGSGKTSLIRTLIDQCRPEWKAGVISGDVAGDVDYQRYRDDNIDAVNIATGKDCHLSPWNVQDALDELDLETLDLIFIENVGNLVCPADIPLGAHDRWVVISVTEGDDMIRKHPLIFTKSDLLLVNKIDLAEAVDVDPNTLVSDFHELNTAGDVLLTNAREREGIPSIAETLHARKDACSTIN